MTKTVGTFSVGHDKNSGHIFSRTWQNSGHIFTRIWQNCGHFFSRTWQTVGTFWLGYDKTVGTFTVGYDKTMGTFSVGYDKTGHIFSRTWQNRKQILRLKVQKKKKEKTVNFLWSLSVLYWTKLVRRSAVVLHASFVTSAVCSSYSICMPIQCTVLLSWNMFVLLINRKRKKTPSSHWALATG